MFPLCLTENRNSLGALIDGLKGGLALGIVERGRRVASGHRPMVGNADSKN
jgi:hypothetical protein